MDEFGPFSVCCLLLGVQPSSTSSLKSTFSSQYRLELGFAPNHRFVSLQPKVLELALQVQFAVRQHGMDSWFVPRIAHWGRHLRGNLPQIT